MKPVIVMKFGGTSLADRACQERAARHILARTPSHQVVAVVSAQGKETDRLAGLLGDRKESAEAAAEADAVLASGEQVSAALFAQLLIEQGQPARSFLGWQVPIETTDQHTEARIEKIDGAVIKKSLAEGQVAVVAGFQGVSPAGRITTLGRGGSDTSAVALAIALKAEVCEIYTDVEGVFTADPNLVPQARCLPSLSYEEMIELASLGARVLQTRSVTLAKRYAMPVRVLPAYQEPQQSIDKSRGTLLCLETNRKQKMEQQTVSGITYSQNEAKITLSELPDRPGVAGQIFAPLSVAGISVDMIAQSSSLDEGTTDITFTIGAAELHSALGLLKGLSQPLGYKNIVGKVGVAKVSVVGVGMRTQSGVASTMFSTLSQAGINIQAISTSEIKISVLVEETQMAQAVQILHQAFGLEHERG